MESYVEFTLLPDDEFPLNLLMDAFLAKLHRNLVQAGSADVGASFPGWRSGEHPTLGTVIRLHGTDARMNALMESNWLQGMRDHLRVEGPRQIPAQHHHLKVERQTPKSAHNMRKRAMRRHGLTLAEAEKRIPGNAGDRLDLPFTIQRSSSTGQRYPLFVSQTVVDQPTAGAFNSYALSVGGTVPGF